MSEWRGPQWEYFSVKQSCRFGDLSKKALDNLGAQGWELVGLAVDTNAPAYVYVFKRPAQ